MIREHCPGLDDDVVLVSQEKQLMLKKGQILFAAEEMILVEGAGRDDKRPVLG
jgi:hypothetical protein